ncbi:MAG: VanZ family protein [Planctomycetota bacterium]
MTRWTIARGVDQQRALRFSRLKVTGGGLAALGLAAVWLILLVGTHLPLALLSPVDMPGPVDVSSGVDLPSGDIKWTGLTWTGKLAGHLQPYDKVIHFGGFAFLSTLLCVVSQPKQQSKYLGMTRYGLVTASLLVYACADESSQHFVPGRVPDVRDLFADAAGVLVGVAVFGASMHFLKRDTRALAPHRQFLGRVRRTRSGPSADPVLGAEDSRPSERVAA